MEIISLDDRGVEFLNQFMPKYLWITPRLEINYIDDETYQAMNVVKDRIPTYVNRLEKLNVGWISTNYEQLVTRDFIFVVFYKDPKLISFFSFLMYMGGAAETYKESVILLTGENPWKYL